jgi:tRNA(Ile)-lysidine synthase
MPSTEQLAQVHQQLLANADKNPAVKVANNYLRRYKGSLYLTADFIDVSAWQTDIDCFDKQNITNAEVIELPDGLGKLHFYSNQSMAVSNTVQRVRLATKEQKVTLRFSHNNPTCLPDYRNHSRSLKKVLQELNIPPWQRKRIPFLYYDDVLVAAIGYFVCQSYIPKNNESAITISNSDI